MMKMLRIPKRHLGALVILTLVICCVFVIINSVHKKVMYDILAFVLYYLGISTDTNVYASGKFNVLKRSDFDWKYLINNPNKCDKLTPFVIIFVKTHPDHFKEREMIRQTWGNATAWKPQIDQNHDSMVMFILGLSKTHTSQLQTMLEKENEKYQDLIQDNFIEDFHNLTVKLVSQYKWPIDHCSRAKYWMTTDDDVFVHVGNLVSYLKDSKSESFYSGLVHAGSPRNTDKKSKYYVPYDVYHGAYYPRYCPGAGYVLSMDVVKKLNTKASLTPFLYIDDVYTGILANFAGLFPQHYVMFLGEKKLSTDLCTMSLFITSHGHKGSQMKYLFNEVMSLSNLNPNTLCWGKYYSWINPHDLVYF